MAIVASLKSGGNLEATDFNELGFPTDGLVAYYPFLNGASDYSGNNLHAGVSGAVLTTNRFNIANTAYDFNATTSVVSAAGMASIFTQAGTYSVALWVWLDSSASNMNVWNFGGSNTNRHNLVIDVNGLYFQLYNGAYVYKSSTHPGLSTWIHVVCTNNNRTTTMYTNSVAATGGVGGYAAVFASNLLYLGYPNSSTNGTRALDGKISDVKIYNRVLTQAEVTQMYNHEVGKFRVHSSGLVTANEFIEDSSLSVTMQDKKQSLTVKGEIISI